MNSHITIKGMEAYDGSYYNSYVAIFCVLAFQCERLTKLFPSNSIENMKGYQCMILNKCKNSFHTLLTVIAEEQDYYAAGTITRMITDNLASYNLIYHEGDETLKHLRHYLFIMDGLAQRKKYLCNHELKYDGIISKDEYEALEKQVTASKENTYGAIEFCERGIRNLSLYKTHKDNIESLINKQNWQFIDISRPNGHYKWEQLYEKISDKRAFTDMTVYFSQFVHGLSISNLKIDKTPSDFEPLLGFGINLMGYARQYIENDFGLSRQELSKGFLNSPYFKEYLAVSSDERKKEYYKMLNKLRL